MFETVSAPPHTLIPKKHGRKAAAGGAHSPLEGAQFLFARISVAPLNCFYPALIRHLARRTSISIRYDGWGGQAPRDNLADHRPFRHNDRESGGHAIWCFAHVGFDQVVKVVKA
jgi:hypothetical protein